MSLAYMRGSTLFFLHASFFGFFSTFTPSTLFKTPLSHCPSITTDHAPPLSSRLPFFSYMLAYLSAAATDASATNTNKTRRGEVGLRSGGIDRERGGGDGRGENLGREWRSSVSVCVSAKSLGVYLTLSSLEQSRYCPPKRSHHALLSVWENLMHGHTETHTKPKIIRNLCDKWSITSEHNSVFSGKRYCSPSCYG